MKTKIIALLLALVVMVGMFASCGLIPGTGTTDPSTDPNPDPDPDPNPNPNPNPNPTPDGPTEKTPGENWDKTTLIFEISENSNNYELGSTSRRYLAGDRSTTTEGQHIVDTLVEERNAAAYKYANVEVTYSYLDDKTAFGWGQNINRINEQVTSGASNSPDIYCNFVYDMVAASLLKSFANLRSTTMYQDGHALAGAEHNYFSFENEIENVDENGNGDDGKDYMTDYMRSLTLSKFKMYCLSSDYFTDMVRAFFVVPVNITMLESLAVGTEAGKYNSDRIDADTGELGQDGKFTVEDFYQLIDDGEWTYETLAAYSNAIYKDTNTAVDGKDIGDKLGFALATSSGLSASGMLYTTSIIVIEREYSADKLDYTYAYPGTEQYEYVENGATKVGYRMKSDGQHKALENFCDAITALFQSNGVLAVSDTDATAAGQSKALLAIRSKFANNTMLFGGVICLGSLEYDEYKDMNSKGKGYGIAPVPLYQEGDSYLTQIHNIGRIGAISYTTKNFAQCTAFLDYQCMNSNEIINTYYDYKLSYDVGNPNVKGNVEMLQYIRYNVHSSFDKAYEDALAFFYSESSMDNTMDQVWHYIIKDDTQPNGGYSVDGEAMRAYYAQYAPIKAQRLYDLENSTFPSLPK